MNHYSKLKKITEIDETNWSFFCKIITDFIPKNKIKDSRFWKLCKNQILEKYKDKDNYDYLKEYISHIIPAESTFYIENPVYDELSDTELVSYLYMNKYKSEYKEILDAMGRISDKYLKYYDFFVFRCYFDLDLDFSLLEKVINKCIISYYDNLEIKLKLMSAYASLCILNDKLNKGISVYEDIFEQDEFSLLYYVQLCDILDRTGEYELEKTYLKKSIEIADTLDNEEISEVLKNSYNYILENIDNKPYESFDNCSLTDIIENSDDFENIEKTIMDYVFRQHPDLYETIYEDDNEENVNSAFEHIKEHALMCKDIVYNKELSEEFLLLSDENLGEHEIIHKFMKRKTEETE